MCKNSLLCKADIQYPLCDGSLAYPMTYQWSTDLCYFLALWITLLWTYLFGALLTILMDKKWDTITQNVDNDMKQHIFGESVNGLIILSEILEVIYINMTRNSHPSIYPNREMGKRERFT